MEIDWSLERLKGTLPVGDMHMPYLRILNLSDNKKLKGEVRGVGVAVVKFTDCVCEMNSLLFIRVQPYSLSSHPHIPPFFLLPSQVISVHSFSPKACST